MEVQVQLYDGVQVGDRTVYDLVMRAPTAGDLLAAQEAAERPVPTPEGWKLLISEARMGAETLRRQVVKIGGDSGPMELATMQKLSAGDLGVLQMHAQEIDVTIAEALSTRGRSDGADGDDSQG